MWARQHGSRSRMFGMLLRRAALGAVLLLALSFPFERERFPWWIELRPGRLKLTNVELILTGAIGLWLASLAASRTAPRYPRAVGIPLLVWIGVLFLSAALAPDQRVDALEFAGQTAIGALIGWMTYDLISTRARWFTTGGAIAIAGSLVGILGIAEALNWPPIVSWLTQFKYAPTRVGEVLRPSSTLIYATIASMVLELTAPLVWAMLFTSPRTGPLSTWAWRGLWATLLISVLTAQALTLTRGGIIALAAAFGFIALIGKRGQLSTLAKGAGIALTLMVGLVLLLIARNPVIALRLISETENMWYQAAYQAPSQISARPGETITVTVYVRNTGVRAWRPTGPYPFALSYHLNRADGSPLSYDGVRTPLPRVIRPGEGVLLPARILAPPEAGEYEIVWDMVQESTTRFSWKGSPTARTQLRVSGAPIAQPILSETPLPDTRLLIPPPGRLTLWRTALRMFLARPLTGVGPDNFRLVYGQYAGVERWDKAIHANSLYLEWLADTGILGLLTFLWFTWRLGREAWHHLRADLDSQHPSVILWRTALIASLVAWFVHGIFDYFYEFTPTYVAFWMLAALAIAPLESRPREAVEKTKPTLTTVGP